MIWMVSVTWAGKSGMWMDADELVDTSVTQSALEEALLSNVQHGGPGTSRISNLSQALRGGYSRYQGGGGR